jgi:2,5-diamino-6-(ribosylamino)-4(3H)-pyrimidinone 5'-phosphate reductase
MSGGRTEVTETQGDKARIAGRPRVICHMMASVDGRIVTDGWPLAEEGRAEYERIHDTYAPDAWLCGRVTMERHWAAGARPEAELAREYTGAPREDFVAPGDHGSLAIAVDPRGKLVWKSGDAGGDHVVAVLTERISDEYLAMLRERGVSYLLAGREQVDLPLALEKIGARLGVRTLMLEGGGGINGSFLRAGLIDEVSLLVAPVADGRVGTPALFDVEGEGVAPWRFALDGVERCADNVLWLRYRVEPRGEAP